jgi:uncharacterized membrane protein
LVWRTAAQIVADRGINLRTGDDAWARIARAVQDEFGHGRYQAGALAGVAAVSREMSRYPPVIDGNPNGAQR